ncbi:long-chain fatty acid--CoA ligase, partial [filamentous cyanobacterium CCP5]
MAGPDPSVLKAVHDRDRRFLRTQDRYLDCTGLHQIWPIAAQRYGDLLALDDPHGSPPAQLTYRELVGQITTFASGLQALGLSPRGHVALFADNSHRWLIADQGIMTAGGVNAVRSATADTQELLYIAEHSNSTVLVAQDLKLLQRLRAGLEPLAINLVILLSDETPPEDSLKVLNFSHLLDLGRDRPLQPVSVEGKDLATLIYTSGTTGKPKGV